MGLAVSDIINTTYTGVTDGQQIRYSLHWKCITGGTSSTAEGDLFAVSAYMQDFALNPLFAKLVEATTANVEFTGCHCSRVYPTKTVIMNAANSMFGAVVGPETPANVAVVITKRTLTPGRRGRGSLHLTGVPNDWQSNSEVNLVGKPKYEALAIELFTTRMVTAVGLSIQPGLFHGGGFPTNFSPLFDARLETTTRTMRRRTVRVGI